MKVIQSFEEAVALYNAFLSQRAFDEGYIAAMNGVPRDRIPETLHVFSGKWVEGWFAAVTDVAEKPASSLQPRTVFIQSSLACQPN